MAICRQRIILHRTGEDNCLATYVLTPSQRLLICNTGDLVDHPPRSSDEAPSEAIGETLRLPVPHLYTE